MSLHVSLTFDFDAVSLWLARGMTTLTDLSRGEFGLVGVERILRLLSEFDIHGTWFIPGHTIDTFPEACEAIVAAGHEVAHHGYVHESTIGWPVEREERYLCQASESIKRLCGEAPAGFRSPSWELTGQTLDLLLKYGFLYDSSLMGKDYTPYHVRRVQEALPDRPLRFGDETALLEMPVSWSLDDFPQYEYMFYPDKINAGLKNPDDVVHTWLEEFRYMKEEVEEGILTFTFHPQISGRGYRMRALRRLIQGLLDEGGQFIRLKDSARAHTVEAGKLDPREE